ncbi:MAG: hypothetical protein Q8S54_06905 [Bacteroidota bacterium]|nr:hypothetical protein [Odoribacter sp.]MDP3642906.1 hypothetical protein [Bacteroidota bacterium]
MGYRKISLLLCFFFFAIGCTKKKCEEVIDQVYVYPIEAAKGKSSEERTEMFKIPEQTLHCLSTVALIKSCISYPEMRLMWTMSDLQSGFDKVYAMCNGFDELWGRGDKVQSLIYLYKQLDFNRDWQSYTDLENGMYIDNIIRHELIIAQYEILIDLTAREKIELFQLALDNQKKKYEFAHQIWGIAGMMTTCAILSRIMYLDKYKPLIEEYTNNELMVLNVAYILILDSDVVNKTMSLSEDYSKILKNK